MRPAIRDRNDLRPLPRGVTAFRQRCDIINPPGDTMHSHSSVTRHSSRAMVAGFTLVELLVVIAILGVLVGLLLPAVQSAREAARRTTCMQRVGQLSRAALSFDSARTSLPVGSHNSMWRTWLVQLLPYVEYAGLYDKYDHRLYLADSQFNKGHNAAVTRTLIDALACPSDPPQKMVFASEECYAHSYVACTGNGMYVASQAGWNTSPPVSPGHTLTLAIASPSTSSAPSSPQAGAGNNGAAGGGAVVGAHTIGTLITFGTNGLVPVAGITARQPEYISFRGGAYQMSGGSEDLSPAEDPKLLRKAIAVRLSDVTDGTSKTLAFSEVSRSRNDSPDYRGLSWWGPGALFSTAAPPNTALPDVMPRLGDCVSDASAPCTCPHTTSRPMAMFSRSRHPGGVVGSTVDGAVTFYSNHIDALVWENLGTTQGDRAGSGVQ
jgi:prepilin-type N-terminal cleavage/methylation domain-containing protein